MARSNFLKRVPLPGACLASHSPEIRIAHGFSSDFARQVKSSADIVRIVGETVRLKKAGSNYVGLCPFHQEKTPSFSVHPVRQFYYCFGCGAKGDVFRFVMETEKADFPEAVRSG